MNKIKTALIGCGAVSQLLYKNALKNLCAKIEVVGVLDINKTNADKFLADFSKIKYYTDIL